jgi:addiction module HigA family antidote
MNTKIFTKNQVPTSATHPGVLLNDEIEYRGITQPELAAWMKIDTNELGVVLHGEKSIDAEFALKLEKVLGVDAYYWLRMQAKYDIDSLRIKEWKNSPEIAGLAISQEPKSAYAGLGKNMKPLE